jgi:hypothetical protein
MFTVPLGTPEDRVQFAADKYMGRFGDALESQGFTVMVMTKPERARLLDLTEHGRTRYLLFAWVKRRPVEHHLWVPDSAVPILEKQGMKLTE